MTLELIGIKTELDECFIKWYNKEEKIIYISDVWTLVRLSMEGMIKECKFTGYFTMYSRRDRNFIKVNINK